MTDLLLPYTDIDFLEQQLRAQGVRPLLATMKTVLMGVPEDYRERRADGIEVGRRTLKLIRNAMAVDFRFLEQHPEALFQCLYNRLRWFDAPDAADHHGTVGLGPWQLPDAHLFKIAEHWREQRRMRGGPPWLESLRPLLIALEPRGGALQLGAWPLCAAFSPDGTRLLTGSDGDVNNVRLWELATGRCLQVLAGHSNSVLSVAWSPEGTQVASGSRDHDVRVWHGATGALLHEMRNQEGRVTAVAFSPEGRWLAAGNLGWVTRLFDAESGQEVRSLEGHEQSVLCLAFHPSGRWLATGSSDHTVRIWEVETGTPVAVVPARTEVRSLAFSPDGDWLALTADEGIALVETQGWTRARTVGSECYSHVAWLAGARLGVLTGATVQVWDARSGALLRTRLHEEANTDYAVAFHPEGQRLAIGEITGLLSLGELDQDPLPYLKATRTPLLELLAAPGGDVALVRQRATSHLAIDATGRERSFPLDLGELYASPWRLHPKDTLLAYFVTVRHEWVSRPAVRLLDLRSLTPARTLEIEPEPGATSADTLLEEPSLEFSPDGEFLAATVAPTRVGLWRVADGTLVKALSHSRPVLELRMEAGCVVTRAADGTERCFELATGQARPSPPEPREAAPVAPSPFELRLGEDVLSIHGEDGTPLAHFPDGMESVEILEGGLVVGQGHTVPDFLYVLKLHPSSGAPT